MMTMKFKKYTQSGFTLIETMVAIVVLGIAIGAPMKLASDSLQNAEYIQRSLTGAFLAEEGIEYIRQYRDSNLLAVPPLDWMTEIQSKCGTGCRVDVWETTPADSIIACSSNCVLYVNNTSGRYSHDENDGPASPYTRRIRVEAVGTGGNEVKVISTVTWTHKTQTYTYVLEGRLLNWQAI